MAAVSFSVLFLLSQLLLLSSTEAQNNRRSNCRPFICGNFGEMKFPFFASNMSSDCGLYKVNCSGTTQKIQLEEQGRWYDIQSISQSNTIVITDPELQLQLDLHNCDAFSNWSRPISPWLSIKDLQTLFKCNQNLNIGSPKGFNHTNCNGYVFYYNTTSDSPQSFPPECSPIQLPVNRVPRNNNIFSYINSSFCVDINVPGGCYSCHYRRRGLCSTDKEGKFQCLGGKEDGHRQWKMWLGIGGGVILVIVLLVLLIIQYRYRRSNSNFLSRNFSSNPYSKSEVEGSNLYFGVPIFSYKELEEATNNFSRDYLLGDGGFGTVYFGKLRDGREIAVKRPYEHSYRRVEQFMNEIQILTGLRHQNLVSLYGCTSRRSRALLLVYEFVPNGTVADHLHGDLAKSSSLTWPIRMRIALEAASALAYLHASGIIHRDVKTNNILLDRNFSVKVADFGLSRLFPDDVTHVSTAPQGTPGYVDPEYHQCYHLTVKSDVYSFGVVLVELISSMPAVDINRQEHEINLSSLAISKIRKNAFHELIDPNLGYETDEEVRDMTRSVAELAFLCLQQDKEMRPSMAEVVQELKRIQNGKDKSYDEEEIHHDCEMKKIQKPLSPTDCNEASLLKNMKMPPPSPISVTQQWDSRYTTPNTSG